MSVQSKLDIKSKNIDTILVLDFGSQYTQLIARRIRESDVYSEILPWDVDIKKIEDINPKGIILSGGPESVTDIHTPRAPKIVFDLQVPILGICYGMQTLAEQMGGQVTTSEKKEFGFSVLNIEDNSKLFTGSSSEAIDVWMSHGDKVETLPNDFKLIASTESAPIAAMEHSSKPIYALQFHPEVTHTKGGKLILDNFIFEICSCKPDWKLDDLISSRIKEIKDITNGEKVLLGLSGGVDSSVTAALLSKAIGENLVCVFVDNGLLRKNEAEEVVQTFKNEMDLNLFKVDAQKIFLRHLRGIEDPEQKRKIIGRTFIDVFDAEAAKLENIDFLAQGTIYPDVIESSGSELKEVGKSADGYGYARTTQCIVVKKLTKSLFESEMFPMTYNNYWNVEKDGPVKMYYQKNIEDGIKLGTQLGKKLQVRGEDKSTIFNRQKVGKIDKRMISSLGFGNENVFQFTEIDSYKKANLHISVDASSSMGGDKWEKTMTNVVALCKAVDMISNLNVQVTFRCTQDNKPYIVMAYDSRVDKFSKVKQMFPGLTPRGTTPEGLCFEAIMKEFVPINNDLDSYFLNLSDGQPYFPGQNFYYGGATAETHTNKMVKMIESMGIQTLAYFVTDWEIDVESSDARSFKRMYGKGAKMIDVKNVNQITKTMNQLFLAK